MSSMLSKYHWMFIEAGYPECDAVLHKDGSWSIRQFHQRPIIPSMTKWNWVLTDIRHREISPTFIKTYLDRLDPSKPHYFEDEMKKSQEAIEEAEKAEQHKEEIAEKATKAITRNEELCERIAKNGIGEIDLDKIAKHIPLSKL